MKGHVFFWGRALRMPVLVLGGALCSSLVTPACEGSLSQTKQLGLSVQVYPLEQGARLTVLNPNGGLEKDAHPAVLDVQVLLFDALGSPVGTALEFRLAPGQGRAWDVPRAWLDAVAEPGSGIASVHLIVRFTVAAPLPAGSPTSEPPVAFLETLDALTGKTRISQLLAESDSPEQPRSQNVPSASLASIGFVPGQALRLSLTNPEEPDPDRPGDDPVLVAQGFLLDLSGQVLARSEELVVPPRQSRSWEVAREALTLPGEPDTGRLQVQALFRYRLLRPRPTAPAPLASVYVLDPVPGSAARQISCVSNLKQIGTSIR